nr:hypothetical protein L203_05426 [Cryptococcus depauperatus CBS 7841]
MSDNGRIQLYNFPGSVWANAPKLALEEGGLKKDKDVEYISINLAEGENFEPHYLRINPAGTVPTLIVGKNSAVAEIVKIAPNHPKGKVSFGSFIIEEIHSASIDPNATFLFATDDDDRREKARGLPKAFLIERQKTLNRQIVLTRIIRLIERPDPKFADFLKKKQADNKQLLEFYIAEPDEHIRKAHYAQTKQFWDSVGKALRGFVTDTLTKDHGGPFVGGTEPSEVDFHLIAWLARTITNAGVEPGANPDEAIKRLQLKTGGGAFDDSIKTYWECWNGRSSFKIADVH